MEEKKVPGLWSWRKEGRNKMDPILTVVSSPIQREPRVQMEHHHTIYTPSPSLTQ